MGRGRAAIAVALMVALVTPVEAGAASRSRRPGPSDWARVQALPLHTLVVAELASGETIKDRIAGADTDSVSLGDGASRRRVSRSDVREIRKPKRSALRKVAGFVLGAVAGALVGVLLGRLLPENCNCDDPHLVQVVYGFFGGAILGAVLGVAIAAKGGGDLIYGAASSPAGP
jgi:uncharacterized membrane protein YoaK (UPF0700 family)